MRRPSLRGSTRRLANKLNLSTAPLSCEALEERRMLSVGASTSDLTQLHSGGLKVQKFSASDGVRTQQEGDLLFRPDRLSLKFSSPPTTLGGATGEHSALNPANWKLLKDNVDVSYLIAGVQVNSDQAVLSLTEKLSAGSYRLIASSRIEDVNGEALRDAIGLQSGDWASQPFVVSPLIETAPETSIKDNYIQFYGVQADAERNYVLVYSRSNHQATQNPLYAQRFDRTGQPIGGEILITTERWATGVDLAMNAAGEFVVSWRLSIDRGNPQLFVKRFAADGTPVGETNQISVADPFANLDTSVAVDDSGDYVLTWSTRTAASENRVWAQRFSAAGTKVGNPLLVGVGEQSQVAMSASGNFVVVWQDAEQSSVYAQLFQSDGTKHGEPIDVGSSTARNSSPRIAMSAAGAFAILYQAVEGNAKLLIQRFDSAGNLAEPATTVVESTGRNADYDTTTLSMDRTGRMVATYGTYQAYVPVATPQVYPPYNPPPHHDYAQFFDANGAAIAPQILLSGQIAMGAGGAVISAEYLTMNYAVTNGFADSYLPVIKSPITVRPYVETGIYVRHYQLPVALTVDLNGDPPGVDHQASFVPGGVRVTVTDPQRARIAGANANQLTSLTVTILNYLVGDELAVSTFRQGITVRFSDGVLKLSGAASVADYQDLLRELTFKTTAARPTGSTVRIRIGATDSAGVSAAAVSTISIHVPGRSSIAGRHIFYNNSGFDGHNPAANAGDDAAIAADKVALLPNQTATFANYTTYTAGINGIMIDLAGEHGAISADDFIFRVGNRNDPAHWSYLPPPQIVVRTGAGVGGSDRIEIIWPDNTIRNAWLQVIMLDNGDTGLVAPDIFLFGNQVGESGNAPDEARVGAADVMRVVKHLLGGGDRTAALNSPLDFNRDGTISAADLMAALNRTLADPSELTLIRIEEESALDGVIRTDPTFMSYDPHPPSLVMVPLSSVVSPVIATDSVFWQFDDEELDALAQPSTLPSPLMLDPYE